MKSWVEQSDSKKTFIVKFDNIVELVRYCKNTPNSSVMKSQNSSHNTGNAGWNGTSSYEEAERLITEGWQDGFKKLADNLRDRNVDEEIQNKRFTPKTDIVGFTPCVPHLLVGRPDTMHNAELHPKKFKIVDIVSNVSASASTSVDEIVKRGIVIVNYINQLEMAGYRCNLHVAELAKEDDEQTLYLTKIKDSTESISIKRIAFPLIHPAMLRRFYFKVLETLPVNSDWCYGYGRPTDDHVEVLFKMHKKTFVFPSYNTIKCGDNPIEYMKKVKEWNNAIEHKKK